MFVCLHVFAPEAVRTVGMVWTPYDFKNKFYSFYVATVVSIISRCGLSIDVHHKNQPNKHKLALYGPLIHFNSSLKWLYMHISSKTERFSYKGWCDMTHIEAFKEELALATNKWLQVISNIMLLKTVMSERN